ncbi:LytR/AlgR family response regulator transcription factor [Amedibacillus sp. YH-ame10]
MRKIAICDDQKEIASFIEDVCRKYYHQKDMVSISYFESGEALLNSEQHFDAMFLDVELEHLNGIETGFEIRKTDHDVLIIMISAHEKYKMDAYPLHVFNFLDKPFTERAIFEVLEKVEEYCDKKKEHIFVSFKMKEGAMSFDISDILYFESTNRKIQLVTKKETYQFYGTIGELSERMKQYGFGIPHASFIVNFSQVQTMKTKEIVLHTGHTIPMTKYKAKEFRESYTIFLKNQIRKLKV